MYIYQNLINRINCKNTQKACWSTRI